MLQLNTEHKEICSQSLISIVLIVLEILNFCVKVSKELSKRLDAGGNLQLSADVGGESGPLLGHYLVSISLGYITYPLLTSRHTVSVVTTSMSTPEPTVAPSAVTLVTLKQGKKA